MLTSSSSSSSKALKSQLVIDAPRRASEVPDAERVVPATTSPLCKHADTVIDAVAFSQVVHNLAADLNLSETEAQFAFRAELGLLLSSRSLVLHVGVHGDVITPLEFFNLLCWKSGDGKTTFIAKSLARVKMIFECAIENCDVSKDQVPEIVESTSVEGLREAFKSSAGVVVVNSEAAELIKLALDNATYYGFFTGMYDHESKDKSLVTKKKEVVSKGSCFLGVQPEFIASLSAESLGRLVSGGFFGRFDVNVRLKENVQTKPFIVEGEAAATGNKKQDDDNGSAAADDVVDCGKDDEQNNDAPDQAKRQRVMKNAAATYRAIQATARDGAEEQQPGDSLISPEKQKSAQRDEGAPQPGFICTPIIFGLLIALTSRRETTPLNFSQSALATFDDLNARYVAPFRQAALGNPSIRPLVPDEALATLQTALSRVVLKAQRDAALNYHIELAEVIVGAFADDRSALSSVIAKGPNDIPDELLEFVNQKFDALLTDKDDNIVRLRHAMPAVRGAVVNVNSICCFICGFSMKELRDIIDNVHSQPLLPAHTRSLDFDAAEFGWMDDVFSMASDPDTEVVTLNNLPCSPTHMHYIADKLLFPNSGGNCTDGKLDIAKSLKNATFKPAVVSASDGANTDTIPATWISKRAGPVYHYLTSAEEAVAGALVTSGLVELKGGFFYRLSPLTSSTAGPTEAERKLLGRKCAVLKFATDSKLSRAELFANYIKKYKDGRDPEKKLKPPKKKDEAQKELDFCPHEEDEPSSST